MTVTHDGHGDESSTGGAILHYTLFSLHTATPAHP